MSSLRIVVIVDNNLCKLSCFASSLRNQYIARGKHKKHDTARIAASCQDKSASIGMTRRVGQQTTVRQVIYAAAALAEEQFQSCPNERSVYRRCDPALSALRRSARPARHFPYRRPAGRCIRVVFYPLASAKGNIAGYPLDCSPALPTKATPD